MPRSPLRNLVHLVLALLVGANALAPTAVHACGAERTTASAGMAAMPGMAGMHHGHGSHGPQPPSPDGDCHCIGHACCSALLALPSAAGAARFAVHSARATPATLAPAPQAAAPDHLHPPPLGPPIRPA